MDDLLDIKEAPPFHILKPYGGEVDIVSFRKSLTVLNKEYITFIPPIKPVDIIIESKNTDNVDDSHKEFVRERSKPLNKKKSVITSMRGGST